jgi:hypothetical protein
MFCQRTIGALKVWANDPQPFRRLTLALTVLSLVMWTACSGFSSGSSTSESQTPTSSPTTPPPPPTSASGKSFTNLEQASGWGQYGQGPPNFVDCAPSPCDGISFLMQQGITNPSLSGAAAEFSLGGTAVYSDALFNNHLIGPFSSQGLPDTNGTLVPTLHTFTYDVYFYGDNLALSQALEFDVNQFFNSIGFIWGHECRIAGGNEWDVWDNRNAKWTPTGAACYPNNSAWNHVTIQVQRTADNQLLYRSITLNGQTSTLNLTFPPGAAPSNWYGITINYQMDGDSKQDPYNIYLDDLNFTYE